MRDIIKRSVDNRVCDYIYFLEAKNEFHGKQEDTQGNYYGSTQG